MEVRDPDRGMTSLVFPTYNPGPTLDRTWKELALFLSTAPGRWEAIFVCDGCTDGTSDRLRALAGEARYPVRIVSYAPNRGKGHAVRQGLLAAHGAWRIFTDVDLAYSFEDILRLASALHAGAEVAIASRTHPESQLVLPSRLQGYVYRRHLQSLAFSALVRALLPITQKDTQAGLKGMTAAAALRIAPLLTCAGFGIDCELLTACARLGVSVVEVPVCVRYEDRTSTTNARSIGRMLAELWRIRRTWTPIPSGKETAPTPPLRRAA